MKKIEHKLKPLKSSRLALASAIAVASAMSGVANAAVLEEIFVTAQKQDQRIMEIPLSVTAVTGDKIEEAGINTLEDMAGFVPGLHIGKGPLNTAINIRGIGSGLNQGFEQSVGMYIDGVYMGRSRQFRSPFLDPQRVEVLRGPQGILFGKNTIAGAINILTADPLVGEDAEGYINAKVEENNTYEATAVASFPVTENVAARLAIKNRQSDGWVDNITRDRDEPETDETTARLTVLWEPSDALSVNVKASYSDYTTEGSTAVPFSKFAPVPGDPGAFAPLVYGLVMPAATAGTGFSVDGDYDTYREDMAAGLLQANGAKELGHDDEGSDTETSTIGVTVDYAFESGWTITSVSAYSEYEFDDGFDSDFLPISFLNSISANDFEQISQELRFTYLEGGPFEFIGGLYYEEQELHVENGAMFDGTFGGLLPVPAAGLPLPSIFGAVLPAPFGVSWTDQIARHSDVEQDSDTLALFGELTYYIRDDLRLTVGGRYSKEAKSLDKTVFVSNSNDGLQNSCTGVVTAGCIIANSFMAGSLGTQAHHLVNNRADKEFFDPSMKLQWDIDYDNMAYISFSQGHKSGGFNHGPDQAVINYTTPGPGHSFTEETAKSIEVGYKGALAGGSVQLGVSIFMTDYEDLQVTSFQGTTFAVSNAAAADLMGLEMDVRWAATDNLELGATFAYLDFEFKDFDTGGCTIDQVAAWAVAGTPGSCVQDLSGKRNAFAPEYSGNVFAEYTRDVLGGLELKATLDVNYKSEMYLDYDLDENLLQAGFAKVNTRVALSNESWVVALYGRNLGDKVTHSFAVDTPLTGGAYTGWVQESRTFGAEAKYMF